MVFNAKQERAIELLAKGDMNYVEMAETIGVTVRTLRRWRYTPEFAEEVKKRATDQLKQMLPKVYSVLSRKAAEEEDLAAIRLFLERIDRADGDIFKSSEGSINFTWGQPQGER